MNRRITYFDYLRIIAVISVISLHIVAPSWANTDVNVFDWQILSFYDSIARWGVPIFVMISGALLLGKDTSIKKLYGRKILRIVVSFFFWSTVYTIWSTLIGNQSIKVKDLIREILTGHYHQWYMFMIVGLYIIIPILNRIVIHHDTAWYFVVVAFVFAIIIPPCIKIIGYKFEGVSSVINYIISNMQLHMVLGYSGYFVLGYLLHHTEIKKAQRAIIYFLGGMALIFTIVSTSVISLRLNSPNGYFYGNLTPNTFFVSISIFIMAKTHFSKRQLSVHSENVLCFFSKCVFGIYLIHPLVLEFINCFFNISALSFNPIISVPLLTLAVFFVSLLISAILNMIPFIYIWIV